MAERPDDGQIREQLSRLVKSSELKSSPSLQKFLTYIVDKTLAGEAKNLKGFSIGVDVFDRGENFDPQADTIVRVQARNLRKALELYYLTDGRNDPVRIDLPKGQYAPRFAFNELAVQSAPPDQGGEPAGIAHQSTDVGSADIEAVSGDPVGNKLSPMMKRVLGAVVAALVILAIVFLISRPQAGHTGFDQAVVLPTGPSVAIKPFEIIGLESDPDGIAELYPFQTGLQIDLVDKISRFKNLLVKAVSESQNARPLGESEDYGTQFLLSGSIQHTNAKFRITSILTRSATGEVLWSKIYDENLAQAGALLEIQSKIAVDVATSLGQPSGAINKKFVEEYSRINDLHLHHYNCLMRFYDYVNEKSAQKHLEIRDCLEHATEEVPNFSSGWAALSWMYLDEFFNNFNVRQDEGPPVERALEAARRGVTADPDNAMAHQYLAMAKFHLGDERGFLESAETALNLNPNDAEVLAIVGNYLIRLDRADEGISMVQKAIELNPAHSSWYHTSLTAHYYLQDDVVTALFHARQMIANDSLASHVLYTSVLVSADQIEEAKAAYITMVDKYPHFPGQYERIIKSRRMPIGLYERLVTDLRIAGLNTAQDADSKGDNE